MGSRKRTPGTTSSAGALAAQRQSTGAVRIARTERGRLTVGELDPDSDVSKQLALVVRQQLLGSGRIDQAALRGVVASTNGIVLVAESDERLGFPIDEIARLLGEIAADPPGPDADEWHAGGASLLRPERVCDPGRVSTGKEEQARAIALRRTAVGLGAEQKQQGTRAEGPGTSAEPAWSDLLNVPNLPEHIIGPLAEVAGAFREINSLAAPEPGRLVPLLERIGDAVSKIIEPLAGVAPEGRDAPPKLVEIRIAEVAPATPGHEAARVPAPAGREGDKVTDPTRALHGELLGRLDDLNGRMTEALEPFSRELQEMLSRLDFASFKDLGLNQAFFEALNYAAGRMEKGWECPKGDRAPSVLRCYPATRMEDGAVTFEHPKDQAAGKKAHHGGFKSFASLKIIPWVGERIGLWKVQHEQESGQTDREGRSPIATTPGEPLRRDGHRLVEDLAALWDERETIERPELVQRFQKLLDRFHDAKSLGSYETNKLATQWVNKLASKNSIKMMLGDTAVTILCADRGKAGFFLPRHAKGKSAAIKGAGSYEFPPVKAIAL